MLNSDRANRIFFFKQMGRFGPVSLLLQSCTLCIVQPPQSLPDPNLTISLFRAWRENQENRFFPGPWSPLAPLAQCEAASESSFAVKLGGQLWGGQGTRMTTSGRIRGTHLYSIQASPPGVAEYAVVPNGRTAREQEETGDRQDDPCPQRMAGEQNLSKINHPPLAGPTWNKIWPVLAIFVANIGPCQCWHGSACGAAPTDAELMGSSPGPQSHQVLPLDPQLAQFKDLPWRGSERDGQITTRSGIAVRWNRKRARVLLTGALVLPVSRPASRTMALAAPGSSCSTKYCRTYKGTVALAAWLLLPIFTYGRR